MMKIILLNKINKLGNLGDLVKVKPGYARNFLIPNGKAIIANKNNIEYFKSLNDKLQNKIEEKKTLSMFKIEEINKIGSIKIFVRVSNEGKLFGSINSMNIVKAINKYGTVNISKRNVKLHERIRSTGEYDVKIQFDNNIFTKIKVLVIQKNNL